MSKLDFVLYSRQGCHLCDVMHETLNELLEQHQISADGVNIELVDIDQQEDLKAKYNASIPVLMLNNEEIARYKLNKRKLNRILSQN